VASSLKDETLRKKRLATESLPDFLARMTLVWEDRQRRLAEAPARAVGATRRWNEKQREADLEGFLARRREIVRRYGERHPERLRENEARARARKKGESAAKLEEFQSRVPAPAGVQQPHEKGESVAKLEEFQSRVPAPSGATLPDAKRAKRSEGYPKIQTKPHRGLDAAQETAVARQSDLSRAWSMPASSLAPRLERRTSDLCPQPCQQGESAAKLEEFQSRVPAVAGVQGVCPSLAFDLPESEEISLPINDLRGYTSYET